jgi:hypothetical protein
LSNIGKYLGIKRALAGGVFFPQISGALGNGYLPGRLAQRIFPLISDGLPIRAAFRLLLVAQGPARIRFDLQKLLAFGAGG